MKKFLTALLTCIILLIPIQANAQSYGFENYYIEATVTDNGDIKVKEMFYMNGDFKGFERIINYKNKYAPKFDGTIDSFKGSDIYNGSGIEINKVGAANISSSFDFNDLYTNPELFEQVTSASKGDFGVYTKEDTATGTRLMIYNPSGKKHRAFYIEYTLKNMAILHNDVAEIGWNLFSNELTESVHHMEVRINIPSNKNELRDWTHGPLHGNIELKGKNQIILTIDDLDAKTALDTRFVFDKTAIPNSEKLSGVSALDKIIQLETELADKANAERERYYKILEQQAITAVNKVEKSLVREDYNEANELVLDLREGELKTELQNRLATTLTKIEQRERLVHIIDIVVSLLYIVGLVYLMRKAYLKYDKEYKSDFTGKYYRDFPAEYGPSSVGYLMRKTISNYDLSASILNLIYKKAIKFQEIPNNKKDFILTKSNTDSDLTPTEQKLMDFVFYNGKDEITLNSLKKYAKKNYSSFLKKHSKWKEAALQDAVNEGFYEDTISLPQGKYYLYIIIGMIVAFFTLQFPVYTVLHVIIIIACVISFIFLINMSKKTQKGINDYSKWMGLKRFMEDFGRMDEKELPEIVLWEKYLVYAVTLGCATKLAKDMEIKIAELGSDYMIGNSLLDFHYFNMMLTFNNVMYSTVNTAVSSANTARIAASSHSSGSGGGGGFSGGFGGGGGGGSFGGGGGGGRF